MSREEYPELDDLQPWSPVEEEEPHGEDEEPIDGGVSGDSYPWTLS